MKLIEVTSKLSGENLYINPEYVCSITKSGENSSTVALVNKETFLVKESCSDLVNKCSAFIKKVHCRWIDKQNSCWYFMPDSKRPCCGKENCKYFENGDGVQV